MANSYVCRRLILLLDGTWNDDEEDLPATNIVYLRELLFWGLQRRFDNRRKDNPQSRQDLEDYEKLDDKLKKKAASGLIFDGFEYVVYYGRGVGTHGLLDSIRGGAFGIGLDNDIRRAYKFLSYWFRPGDEIYVFGFSRGAFTARSLCGYLHAVGLLRCENCTDENERLAWKFYRTKPQDRLSADWEYFRKTDPGSGTTRVHDAASMRIRALGVFDTVGALGIPGKFFWRSNREKYAFHDTEVNTSVDIRLHAMAIDEPRPEFVASVWTKPKFKRFNNTISPTEQVWFPGAHGDVGGGYVKWTDSGQLGLSHIPLVWMLQRLNHHLENTDPIADTTPPQPYTIEPRRRKRIPFFPKDFFEGATEDTIQKRICDVAIGDQHSPWGWARRFRRNNARVMNQLPHEPSKNLQAKGRIQHADPIGEMIHISAFERLHKSIKVETTTEVYGPCNLVAAIPFVAASYQRKSNSFATPWKSPLVEPIFEWSRIYVVGWDGMPYDPANPAHAETVLNTILPRPDEIGLTKMPAAMKPFCLPARVGPPAAAAPVLAAAE